MNRESAGVMVDTMGFLLTMYSILHRIHTQRLFILSTTHGQGHYFHFIDANSEVIFPTYEGNI